MSAHREEHLDLCAAYALGGLDDADRRELETHLADGCEVCEREIARHLESARLLAAAAPPLAPPPALRSRVLEAARREPRGAAPEAPPVRVVKLEPRRGAPRFAWGWAAAAAALAVVSLLAWNQAERLRRELAATRDQLAQAERAAAEERRWAQVLDAPGSRVVALAPTAPGAPAMHAHATYDPASRRAVLVFDGVAVPAGSDYQLWALRGPGVASLGLLHADASGHAVVRIEDAGDPALLAGFAVSLERAGGSSKPDAPEGPVVMAGKFGG